MSNFRSLKCASVFQFESQSVTGDSLLAVNMKCFCGCGSCCSCGCGLRSIKGVGPKGACSDASGACVAKLCAAARALAGDAAATLAFAVLLFCLFKIEL